MANLFALTLSNPDISGDDKATIYTGLDKGNKLDLTLTNNSGFDASFTSSTNLLIKIAKTLIDEEGIQGITVAAPWTTDGYYTPDNDPDKSDNKAYYVLKLKAPSDGVTFKAGSDNAVTINLDSVSPSAKGTASLFACYDFPGIEMITSATLAALAAPNDNDKPLLGNENALRMTVRVNNGSDTNPLVFTDSEIPVTGVNAAENIIHINLNFQDQNLPSTHTQTGLGYLLESWDPNNPPTFQIQFPYFSANAKLPARYDLTNDFSQGDPNYNQYTSARNIRLSLSATDPKVLSNDWWEIIPPANDDNAPFWKVQPKTANSHVFTGVTKGTHASGPFLDLYFSHIYSNLPIDQDSPETLLYVETYNFEGFNDRLTQLPLFKEPSVKINKFSGEIDIQGDTTTLQLIWDTENTEYCELTGSSERLLSNNLNNPFRQTIDLTKPLKSSYTLTAFGQNGRSKIQKTIYIKWKQSSRVSPQSFDAPGPLQVSPDGNWLYLVVQHGIKKLDSSTLVTQEELDLENDFAKNVVLNSNGSIMYVAIQDTLGNGRISAYDSSFKSIDVSSAPGGNAAPNLYPMALSADDSQLAINQSRPLGPSGPNIQGFTPSDLKTVDGSPYSSNDVRGIGLAFGDNNLYFSDSQGLGVLDSSSFTPVAHSPVSIKSDQTVSYSPGPIAVSADNSTAATLALGYNGADRAFVLCTVDVGSTPMALKSRNQVFNGFSANPEVVSTGLGYSYDDQYLFVFGADYAAGVTDHNTTRFSVFNPDTLQELSWSPIQVDGLFGSIAMAPDGARIYASVVNTSSLSPSDPPIPKPITGSVRTLIPYFD